MILSNELKTISDLVILNNVSSPSDSDESLIKNEVVSSPIEMFAPLAKNAGLYTDNDVELTLIILFLFS